MHSGKLHYVSANPGGGAATLSGASSVYCVLGSPPQWRRYSRLLWRQGPALLLEEVSQLIHGHTCAVLPRSLQRDKLCHLQIIKKKYLDSSQWCKRRVNKRKLAVCH